MLTIPPPSQPMRRALKGGVHERVRTRFPTLLAEVLLKRHVGTPSSVMLARARDFSGVEHHNKKKLTVHAGVTRTHHKKKCAAKIGTPNLVVFVLERDPNPQSGKSDMEKRFVAIP